MAATHFYATDVGEYRLESLDRTLGLVGTARDAGLATVASARSGETCDTTIVDLAVGSVPGRSRPDRSPAPSGCVSTTGSWGLAAKPRPDTQAVGGLPRTNAETEIALPQSS